MPSLLLRSVTYSLCLAWFGACTAPSVRLQLVSLMSLAWMAYMFTILYTRPGWLPDTLALSRLNVAVFVLYVACFCVFTWRFGAQRLPRVERALWLLAVAGMGAVLLAPRAQAGAVMAAVWVGFVLVFFANCLQFQWHAWRPRPPGRDPRHLLLWRCVGWCFWGWARMTQLVVLSLWRADESWGRHCPAR